jgi:hypothetical protein
MAGKTLKFLSFQAQYLAFDLVNNVVQDVGPDEMGRRAMV